MLDWQDIRFFIALARGKTLPAAANKVGVDAATISRRVARLEQSLRSTLFSRSSAGMTLTAAGAHLYELATQAESFLTAAEEISTSEPAGGTLRLSVAEGFGTEIIAPNLPDFRERYPFLSVELIAEAGFLSAVRREVDAVVTLSAPSDKRLVVEPLTEYQLGLYASPSYLARHGPLDDLRQLSSSTTVGYVIDRIYAPELQYLDDLNPGIRPTLSSSSIRAQKAILEAGGCVGVLPCFMESDNLKRVLANEYSLRRQFWLGIHRDLSSTRRGTILRRWLKELVALRRDRLMPKMESNYAKADTYSEI